VDNITSQDNNLYQSQIEIRSNSNYSNSATLKLKCMGKGCDNFGKSFLKIKYINKVGYFCEKCTKDLLNEELAVEVENN
jgi:hypothetical protein